MKNKYQLYDKDSGLPIYGVNKKLVKNVAKLFNISKKKLLNN